MARYIIWSVVVGSVATLGFLDDRNMHRELDNFQRRLDAVRKGAEELSYQIDSLEKHANSDFGYIERLIEKKKA